MYKNEYFYTFNNSINLLLIGHVDSYCCMGKGESFDGLLTGTLLDLFPNPRRRHSGAFTFAAASASSAIGSDKFE